MAKITYTPNNFIPGDVYSSQLLLNNVVVGTHTPLVAGQQRFFEITEPGTYTLKVFNNTDNTCIYTQVIQSLFPLFTYTISDVNCNNNTYTVTVTVTNPATSGSNIRYGWSTINDSSTVTNWSGSNSLILNADSTTRYVFIKNDVVSCQDLVTSTLKDPCVVCDLTVTGITFTCD